MNLVPGGLFLRYTLLAPLEVTSGEADLWFVRHDQTEYVLKLYRYGIEPKAVMTQKLQALAAQHVVKLEEHGKFGNRAYEVLEKIEHGDLRKLAKPVAAEQLKEVLKELSEAVSHLHTEGILHRDLKPANVLMRSREPLDLVLTDFGISSLNEGTMHLTNANRTASYSAPEALTGVVSAASDWWSVGVMVLELLKGVHPFAGKSEQVINFQLVSKGVQIPADTAAEWAELLKGLLTRDHEHRWQGEQVAKWLTGARNQPTHYEGDRQQTHTHKPYQFGEKQIYTAKELAIALSGDWGNGAKNFGRGFVAEWVKSDLRNFDLASRLLDVYEDKELSADEKLSAALVEMDRSLPAMWRGNVVNREWAAREPESFQALLGSRVRPKLEKQPGWPVELIKKLIELKAAKLPPEQLAALERVVITGNPQLKIGDWEVTPETLSEHPERAVTVLEGQLPALYQQLTEQAWLLEAAERWLKYWPRVEALGCGTRAEKALPWILGSADALQARVGSIASQYVESSNEALDRLWNTTSWGTAECVAACAADQKELLTPEAQAATQRGGVGERGSVPMGPADAPEDATKREDVPTGAGHLNLVPGGLFLRYTLLAPLEVTSGEADLWFIRHDQTEYVLKLYRYGIEPKAELTARLQALAAKHVVKVEEHGKFGNRAYEVLEKIEHGDLRKLAKPVAAEQLKEVLKELSEAVSHLHTEGILHRDLKPANVLMRSREPLDLVLTDFGISSLNEGTMHLTNANRTASYSAPEALTGVVSAASDWWSVGVMVLELLKGVHPFAGKSEQVINFQLVSKGIVIPADTAADWAELLKGLLTRDHEQRWQGEQVAQWLAGARNPPAHSAEAERFKAESHPATRKWYRQASGGDADAQFNLGWCYENGNGVPEDKVEGVKWYRLAAEQGYADAQTNLGFCYSSGNGVPEDKVEAVKWYRLAAEQGLAPAQFTLGWCYYNGNGVPKDKVEAVKWYRLAAEQGYADALQALSDLGED